MVVLNVIGPARLVGSGIIRKCGLGGVDVALVEEVCHWGWALRAQMLPVNPDIEPSCFSSANMLSYHGNTITN